MLLYNYNNRICSTIFITNIYSVCIIQYTIYCNVVILLNHYYNKPSEINTQKLIKKHLSIFQIQKKKVLSGFIIQDL